MTVMFQPRIYLVDDNELHLTALGNALKDLGYAFHAVLYTSEDGVGDTCCTGMRVLFLDYHLISGGPAGGAGHRDISVLESTLNSIVDPNSGPYALILWTQHPDRITDFAERFRVGTTIDSALRPVSISVLSKTDFINTTTGDPVPSSNLSEGVSNALKENTQMAALFAWEKDATVAAHATIQSIIDLVTSEKRGTEEFSQELGEILFRLIQAGSGHGREQENPRDAVNQTLVPILADRILSHDPEGSSRESWAGAAVPSNDAASVEVRARINSAIHIAEPLDVSSIEDDKQLAAQNTELGTVLGLSENADEICNLMFEMNADDVKKKILGIQEPKTRATSDIRLVRYGATCDNAQPNASSFFSYLLGYECEFGTKFAEKDEKAATIAIWRSPAISSRGTNKPGQLVVHLRNPITLINSNLPNWIALYRLREPLVNELSEKYARLISRPGIVSLRK
jgi:hypothetical protein